MPTLATLITAIRPLSVRPPRAAKLRPRSIHFLARHASRRSAVIEVEHPTKPRTAMDHAVIRGNGLNSPDQAVVQPLMTAFSVIMGDVFSPRATKRRLCNEIILFRHSSLIERTSRSA